MQRGKKFVVLVLVGVMGVSVAMPAMARRGADDTVSSGVTVTPTVTREQAITTAKAQLDGVVVKAKLELEHSKAVWKIRIRTTDGAKRGDFRIDAVTGQLLRSKIKTIRGKGRGLMNLTQKIRTSDDRHHDEDGDDRGRRHGGHGSDDK